MWTVRICCYCVLSYHFSKKNSSKNFKFREQKKKNEKSNWNHSSSFCSVEDDNNNWLSNINTKSIKWGGRQKLKKKEAIVIESLGSSRNTVHKSRGSFLPPFLCIGETWLGDSTTKIKMPITTVGVILDCSDSNTWRKCQNRVFFLSSFYFYLHTTLRKRFQSSLQETGQQKK